MKTVDRRIWRNVSSSPDVTPVDQSRLNQFQARTVRILECNDSFAETFLCKLGLNPLRSKPLAPVLTRFRRDSECVILTRRSPSKRV